MAIELPPPREFGWTLKSVESARTTTLRLTDGRTQLAIDHDLIHGITTEMLAWWFQSFDGEVTWAGQRLQAYLLWHPCDHVAVRLLRGSSGRLGFGDRLHITEMCGRDPRFTVDQTGDVHRWDGNGVGFHFCAAGQRVFNLDHSFEDVAGGVRYRSRAIIGAEGLFGGLVNVGVTRRFDAEMSAAWVRHNVEEIGCFENFLAELFERETRGG